MGAAGRAAREVFPIWMRNAAYFRCFVRWKLPALPSNAVHFGFQNFSLLLYPHHLLLSLTLLIPSLSVDVGLPFKPATHYSRTIMKKERTDEICANRKLCVVSNLSYSWAFCEMCSQSRWFLDEIKEIFSLYFNFYDMFVKTGVCDE